jgi:hypothetical protein
LINIVNVQVVSRIRVRNFYKSRYIVHKGISYAFIFKLFSNIETVIFITLNILMVMWYYCCSIRFCKAVISEKTAYLYYIVTPISTLFIFFLRGYSLIGKTTNLHFVILGSIPNISKKIYQYKINKGCLLI